MRLIGAFFIFRGNTMLPFRQIIIYPGTMKLKLDIDIIRKNKPFIIVVGDGRARMYDLPEHGGQSVIMHQSKIKRMRLEDGDEW